MISVFHGILAIYSISRKFFPWCQLDVGSKQRRSHLVHRRSEKLQGSSWKFFAADCWRNVCRYEGHEVSTHWRLHGSWRSLISPQERCDSRRIDWWTVVDFRHRRSQRIGCHLLSNGPYPFSSSLRHSYNLAFRESLRFGGRHHCTLGEPLAKCDFFLITIYIYVRSRLTILIANLLKTISSSMGDLRDWSNGLTSFWYVRLRPGRALIDLINITSTIFWCTLGTRVNSERCRSRSCGRLLGAADASFVYQVKVEIPISDEKALDHFRWWLQGSRKYQCRTT